MYTLLVILFEKVCVLRQWSKRQRLFPTISINSTVTLMLADVRMQRRECHLLSGTEIKCGTKGKGKVPPLQARCGPEVGRGIALSSKTSTLEAARPGRTLPPGKTRFSLYRRLGGPQGRSGQVRKISPPPRFDPRTVQPVVSRYTD
jgi:hypothetical protein